MFTLYGIKNCDTVKKARKWLDNHQIAYQFHDFRVDGLEPALVTSWLTTLGWETLINKRSTTWKQLSDQQRSALNDSNAAAIILLHPTLIKRPLLDTGTTLQLGFKDADYQHLL